MKTVIFLEGYGAFLAGYVRELNPYPLFNPKSAAESLEGWEKAQATSQAKTPTRAFIQIAAKGD